MRKYCNLLVLILFLLMSCSQKQDNILTVEFKQEQNITTSNILEMDFIKLETNENCLINKTIRQIESAGDRIFVLTGGEGVLLLFDFSGNFITQIGHSGNGPGEYTVVTSFSIDTHKNIVSVIDAAQQKIITYSMLTYEFISQQKVSDCTCFEYLGDDKIVWNNTGVQDDNSAWSFIVTDINQNYINRHVKKDFITGYHTAPLKNMYKSGNTLYVYPEYNSIIYRFDENEVVPYYRLEFGKYKWPPLDYFKKFLTSNVNFLSELNQLDYIYTLSVFEADEYLGVCYSASQIYYLGFYNKSNRQIYNCSLDEFQNKSKTGKIDKITGRVNDCFVAILQPFKLLELKEKNYSFPEKLQILLDKSRDDDNPILFLFKLKK